MKKRSRSGCERTLPKRLGVAQHLIVGSVLVGTIACEEFSDEVAVPEGFEAEFQPSTLAFGTGAVDKYCGVEGDVPSIDSARARATLTLLTEPRQVIGRDFSGELSEGRMAAVRFTDSVPSAEVAALEAYPKRRSVESFGEVPIEDKVDLRLLKDAKKAASDHDATKTVKVIVSLPEEVDIPRFPRVNTSEARTSPSNAARDALASSIVDTLTELRRPGYEERSRQFECLFGARTLETYWLIPAMVVEVPLPNIVALAERADVGAVVPVSTSDPPPMSYISAARALMLTDPYRSGYTQGGQTIGLIDTGVWNAHTLFSNPSSIYFWRDCMNGSGTTCGQGSNLNPSDICPNHGHGTGMASIVSNNGALGANYNSVTGMLIDSWRAYDDSCFYHRDAGVRAFEAAVYVGDDIIIAEIQTFASNAVAATEAAAEAAFDAGAVVLAANGNRNDVPASLMSPARAHRVLAVGAQDVDSPYAICSGCSTGDATDGRTKPDITGPHLYSLASIKAATGYISGEWWGTSVAAAAAGAAAAHQRNRLRLAGYTDPGQVYAHMIMNGDRVAFDSTYGAGLVKLPVNGWEWWGSRQITTEGQVINISLSPVTSPTSALEAAIWWPEDKNQTHNQLYLALVSPSGTVSATSTRANSVFQKVRKTGAIASGTWTLRITGADIHSSQKVYYAAFRRY